MIAKAESGPVASLLEGERPIGTPIGLLGLLAVCAAMMFAAVYMVFMYAPLEKEMGFIQKIFYFHVPSAWNMFFAVGVACVGSVGFLIKRTDRWDRIGDTGTELAIVFGIMVLISGPLWGRKAWGAYWVWDVRLTSSLVLVLTMIAAKIVRGYAGPSAKQIAAGLTVFAVLDSVFVYYSVDIWRGTHPPKLVQTLETSMKQTFWFCVLTFLLVFVSLLWVRLRMGKLKSAVDRAHMLATEAGLHD
jgi:heme exporter protein C